MLTTESRRMADSIRQCPVASGAMTVQHVLDQSSIRAQYAIGLLFVSEPFRRSVHVDAVDENGQRNARVVKDRWYSEEMGSDQFVVEDRIRWLIKQVSWYHRCILCKS